MSGILRMVSEASPVVLVVDDQPSLCSFVARMLQRLGFATIECGGPRDALAIIARRADIALVVSDIEMPDGSGVEFALALQRTHPTIRVLLMSGRIDDVEAPLVLLAKPFTAIQLKAAIARLFA